MFKIKILTFLFSGCFAISAFANKDFQIQESKLMPIQTSQMTTSGEEMQKLISPYKLQLNELLQTPIGTTDSILDKFRPESPLSNLCTDMLLAYSQKQSSTPVDIAILNMGGLRKALPKGTIRLQNIYELMPFENQVVIVELSGSEVIKLFENIAKKEGEPIAGARLEIKNGQLVSATIQRKEIIKDKTYYIATSDYLVGGNDFIFEKGPKKTYPLNVKLRDVFIEEIKELTSQGQLIHAKTDNRIYVEK